MRACKRQKLHQTSLNTPDTDTVTEWTHKPVMKSLTDDLAACTSAIITAVHSRRVVNEIAERAKAGISTQILLTHHYVCRKSAFQVGLITGILNGSDKEERAVVTLSKDEKCYNTQVIRYVYDKDGTCHASQSYDDYFRLVDTTPGAPVHFATHPLQSYCRHKKMLQSTNGTWQMINGGTDQN